VTDTPETSRQDFEEWAKDKFTSLKIDPEDDEYIWIDTQLAWVAWQASREKSIEHRKLSADDWRNQIQNADLRVRRMKCELATVTEQRDRLTEALEYILGIGLTQKTKAKAEKALQTTRSNE
jgi:hypothetical protein